MTALWSRIASRIQLEVVPQSHLHGPRTGQRAAEFPEGAWCVQVCAGGSECRVIENVVPFRPKCHCMVLSQLEALHYRHVEVGEKRSAESVAARVANFTGSRKAELSHLRRCEVVHPIP